MRKIAPILLGLVALTGCGLTTTEAPPKDPANAPGATWRHNLACGITLYPSEGC